MARRPAPPGRQQIDRCGGDRDDRRRRPPAPTPEARELVAKAAEVVEQLHEHNRELHFSRDETTNRVVIEVRDLDGNVIKTIPPAKALDILSGARALRSRPMAISPHRHGLGP